MCSCVVTTVFRASWCMLFAGWLFPVLFGLLLDLFCVYWCLVYFCPFGLVGLCDLVALVYM